MMSSIRLNRRRLLKEVSSSFPLLLASAIHAGATAPSERIRLGFIGIGLQALSLLPKYLKRTEVLVVAVSDVDTTRRENAKNIVDKKYQNTNCQSFGDFRKLLEVSDIDAVVIAAPNHWHAYISIMAVNEGKDVYCERPLSFTVNEASVVERKVQASGRVFQTGSSFRSLPEFRVACELVRNGVIGKISHVETAFGGPARPNSYLEEPPEPGLDWELWCGPAPLSPYNSALSPRGVPVTPPMWRMVRDYGGGMICDVGADCIDIAHWGLGADASGPLRVSAPENWETAESGARLLYAGETELRHVRSGMGISFYGTNGIVHVGKGQFELVHEGKTRHRFLGPDKDPGTTLERECSDAARNYLADAKIRLETSDDHVGNFLAAMRSRRRPINDASVGAGVSIACQLLCFAYHYGAQAAWNPAERAFASGGNAEWLTRVPRTPYNM